MVVKTAASAVDAVGERAQLKRSRSGRRRAARSLAVVLTWCLLGVIAVPNASALTSEVGLDWAIAAGGTGEDAGLGVAVDGAGNSHVTGYFNGTVDFDPGPAVASLTSNGGVDVFVAVYGPGGALVSAIAVGGTGFDVGSGVAVDAAGASHITGYFNGTVDFDPGSGVTELVSNGTRDVFVAVYGPDGALVSAIAVGGTGSDSGSGVAVDAAGNSHVTGYFEGTVDFDPGPGVANLTSNGGLDVFVAVYGPGGGLVSAIAVGGTGTDQGFGVAVDGAGNTHVTGSFSGTVDFDPGSGVAELTANGSADVIVAMYSPDGALMSAIAVGSNSADQGSGVAVDGAGNSHVTGFFSGTVDFDPGSGVAELTSNGSADVFVAVYSPDGALMSAIAVGSTDFDQGRGVAVDGAGNSHITGSFGGTVDFDPSSGVTELTSNGGSDLFVAVYSPDGNLVSAINVGGAGSDSGQGLAADAAGASHVTGHFSGTVDFDPGPGTVNVAGGGATDVFLARYVRLDSDLDGFEGPNGDGTDCDDTDAAVNPGAVDVAGNGVDEDCNGSDAVVVVCVDLVVTIDMNTNGGNGTGTAGDDVILGTPGADVIDAGAGDDTVCAGDGDDVVVGGDGDDTIFGEGGRDVARGNTGSDVIDGGPGNDRLLGGIGGDTINGGEGNDFIGGFGGDDIINGGAGNETIFGGFGKDTISGGPGSDNIRGLIGDDTINGGGGDDMIFGDKGNDTLSGGAGNDTVAGGNAEDQVNGNDGDDILGGGKRDDVLNGGPGIDICSGNAHLVADIAIGCETVFGVP